ncbi:transposase [Cupriavidus basilensis]|uniref:transposase n=1 Tax=Cupriavidus basilensis TaxID=68895 RepID=UPI0023E82D00|nr:transposase [Cupriavidus basilensis]MDF3883059.1 transposase [Cupriavidus basilensis]
MPYHNKKRETRTSCYVPKPALWLGSIVTDIPPVVQPLGQAICRTPDELIINWARFGCAKYAVEDSDDGMTWYFTSDLQTAAALGFKWLEKGCALEQIPEERDGEVVYAYVARGLEDVPDLEHLLYSDGLWKAVGADPNEAATPRIMTRFRVELFKLFAHRRGPFVMLDFFDRDKVGEYLADWANELK